jgi:hypothetical protein
MCLPRLAGTVPVIIGENSVHRMIGVTTPGEKIVNRMIGVTIPGENSVQMKIGNSARIMQKIEQKIMQQIEDMLNAALVQWGRRCLVRNVDRAMSVTMNEPKTQRGEKTPTKNPGTLPGVLFASEDNLSSSDSSSVPLPTPAEQPQRAEAGGKEWESGGERRREGRRVGK